MKLEDSFNKIVHDNLPNIIKQRKGVCKYHTVTNQEAIEYLVKRLKEEAEKLTKDLEMENLIELQELIDAILDKLSVSKIDFLRAIRNKEVIQGAYNKNIILDSLE